MAASNLVGIVASDGSRAAVTHGGQLEATQTSPANIVALYVPGAMNCDHFYTVPKGRALIIESVTFNTLSVGAPGNGTYAGMYATSNCTNHYFLDHNPAGVGEVSVPMTPGVALKAGTPLSLHEANVDIEVYVYGYLVPAADVSANHVPAALAHSASAQTQR